MTSGTSRAGPGEADGKRRSLTQDAGDGQVTSHRLGEGSGQGQPDPGALDLGPFGAEPLERDEDALQVIGRQARPGIGDHDAGLAGVLRSAGDRDAAVPVVVLDGIRDQVNQDLGQPLPVDEDRQAGGTPSAMIWIERSAAIGAMSRQVSSMYPVDAVAVLLAELGQLEKLGEAEDGVQRGAQLVARAGQERVLRLGRPHGRVPGLGQVGGPSGQQLFGPEMQLADTADLVTRIDDGLERQSRRPASARGCRGRGRAGRGSRRNHGYPIPR